MATSITFTPTGSDQTYTIPEGVSSFDLDLGSDGRVQTTGRQFTCTAGDVLTIQVSNWNAGSAYPNGGTPGGGNVVGTVGQGATRVYLGSTLIAAAGGRGGTGGNNGGAGGRGGGGAGLANGAVGSAGGAVTGTTPGSGGAPGTTVGGGAGGVANGGNGANTPAGTGGDPSSGFGSLEATGGGGGGGWTGGGGGGQGSLTTGGSGTSRAGGGGGGSSGVLSGKTATFSLPATPPTPYATITYDRLVVRSFAVTMVGLAQSARSFSFARSFAVVAVGVVSVIKRTTPQPIRVVMGGLVSNFTNLVGKRQATAVMTGAVTQSHKALVARSATMSGVVSGVTQTTFLRAYSATMSGVVIYGRRVTAVRQFVAAMGGLAKMRVDMAQSVLNRMVSGGGSVIRKVFLAIFDD